MGVAASENNWPTGGADVVQVPTKEKNQPARGVKGKKEKRVLSEVTTTVTAEVVSDTTSEQVNLDDGTTTSAAESTTTDAVEIPDSGSLSNYGCKYMGLMLGFVVAFGVTKI